MTFFSVTEEDDEGNNSLNNPPESGPGVAVSVSGPESRKTPVRGQTTGAVSAAAAANDSFNEGSQIFNFFAESVLYWKFWVYGWIRFGSGDFKFWKNPAHFCRSTFIY